MTFEIPEKLREQIRDKRQLANIPSMVVTSLITYFSTEELVSMAQDDDEDLYDSPNNLLSANKTMKVE